MISEKLESLGTVMRARERDLNDAQMAYQRAKREYHEEEARLLVKSKARRTKAPSRRSK